MASPHFTFTREQARTMLIAAQGLLADVPQPVGKEDVLVAIKQMGVLQIDTISVVARSPYLVLWSRLGDYDPIDLERLLEEGRLFEYWSHAACFIPIEDYRLYRSSMLRTDKHPWRFEWLDKNPGAADAILNHVRENGAIRSSDFERTDGQTGNWWNWKNEKMAMDFLHTSGELMIAKRERFQRVYDLRERVHPTWRDQDMLPYEEAVKELVENTVEVLGVPLAAWCADYYRFLKKETLQHLATLESEGKIVRAQIQGLPGTAYVSAKHIPLAQSVLNGEFQTKGSTLLSPFDPIVWDRKRALELFDFDYRIECYVPEPKRIYGYFVLPILVDNRLVGRLDAKAHRKEKVFEVKKLFLEPGVEVTEELVAAIGDAIKRCAAWHKTPKVKVVKANVAKLASAVQRVANGSSQSILKTSPLG